ncbi:hypothetical protein BJ165DRAFT_1503230 [Panaeolus papilionaceus]|nr:hypothetical protein BJ165DRAFT_1503230 [Panaeolus papilionaceus]
MSKPKAVDSPANQSSMPLLHSQLMTMLSSQLLAETIGTGALSTQPTNHALPPGLDRYWILHEKRMSEFSSPPPKSRVAPSGPTAKRLSKQYGANPTKEFSMTHRHSEGDRKVFEEDREYIWAAIWEEKHRLGKLSILVELMARLMLKAGREGREISVGEEFVQRD